ncbi:Sorting nexin mvp1 [Thecaphora frezii]
MAALGAVDDPWQPSDAPHSPNPSDPESTTNTLHASNLGLTCAGNHSTPTSSHASTFPAASQATALPDVFPSAWALASSRPTSHAHRLAPANQPQVDSDISLAQLHTLLTTAAALGPTTAEAVVNLCCSGSRCSRYDFYLALVLLRQSQDFQPFDLKRATLQLQSANIKPPALDLDALAAAASFSAPSTFHTFPPPVTPSTVRPPGPMREMSDPWNTTSTGPSSACDRAAPFRDGLPSSLTSGFNSTFRGFGFSSDSESLRNKAPNGHSGLPAGGQMPTVDSDDSQRGFGSSSTLSPPRALDEPPSSLGLPASRLRQGVRSRARPFSYISDTLEANAVGAADDPEAELPVDEITVRLRSELEGFIIKHNVYVVTSELRNSSVVRRYSDWVWLAECLVKRYPFRCLPLLPPKRISIPMAGRHLSGEDQFIERRRRGLERYLRVLSSHPVLRQDRLVEMFFTEKQALSEWRQTAPPLYLEEEGMTKVLDEVERMSIPEDLDAKLAQQRKAIPELLERWSSTVALFERMVKRNDAAAADFSRFNFGLLSLVESLERRWRPESEPTKAAERCLGRVADSYQEYADLLSARTSSSSLVTLETLKHQRDLVGAFRDLLARLDRLLPDQVDTLKRRIEAQTNRAAQVKKEERTNWQSEHERLTAQVASDTETVEKLLNRRVHARKSMWEEMVWLHWRMEETEEAWKRWTRDEVVFAHSAARNWEMLGLKLDM